MNFSAVHRLPLFALLILAATTYGSAQECLSYEPESVKLTGTISKKIFPGPPNYESIRKGDVPETSWVLHLAKPICTTASGDNDAESGVMDIQLILTARQYTRYRSFVDRRGRVGVTGKLTHAMTGHHHTKVLMDVTSIHK